MELTSAKTKGPQRGFTRECLAIEVDTRLPGLRVGRVPDGVIQERGRPEVIVTDNGPEISSRVFDQWCYQRRIGSMPDLDFLW